MRPGKTLQMWGLQPSGLSQQEPLRNSVRGDGSRVYISLILTRFPQSFLEVENLGQNVVGHFGNNDSQMALARFVIGEG